MKALFITLLLIGSPGYAAEDWLCTDEGITRQGTVFLSCGMGEAHSESVARRLAFMTAKNTFEDLCDIDTGCKHHEINVDPGRTTCEKVSANTYKCYELLRFSIGKKAKKY